MNPPKIHGLKINMSRTDDGENLLRPTSLCYLAPFHNPAFCVLLLATALQEEYFPVQNGPNRPKSHRIRTGSKYSTCPNCWTANRMDGTGKCQQDSRSRILFEQLAGRLLTLILLIPLAEEIAFRSWLLDRLGQVLAPSIALLISAAAFSAVHPMGFIANLIFLLPGLVWGYLWLRYRSLFVCTLAHATYNATAITMASLQSV